MSQLLLRDDAIVVPSSQYRTETLSHYDVENLYLLYLSAPEHENFDVFIRRRLSCWRLIPRDDASLGCDCSCPTCKLCGICKHVIKNAMDMDWLDVPGSLCFAQLGRRKKRGRPRGAKNRYHRDVPAEEEKQQAVNEEQADVEMHPVVADGELGPVVAV